MADARNEPQWNSRVPRSELISGEPIGMGSRFLTVNRGQEYNAEITVYERPQRLVYDVTGKGMDITAEFQFSSDGAGTRMEERLDFRPKGAMRIMFALLAPAVRRDVQKQSARFKVFCERA